MNVVGVDAVGVWSFDEGSGSTVFDKSGYGNHGTITGATFVDGEENTPHWYVNQHEGRSALSFNGTSDYVSIADNNSLDITDAITIEVWVKPLEKSSTYRVVISKGSNSVTPFDIRMDRTSNGNHIFGKVQTSSGSVSSPSIIINNNQWYHVVLAYDGTKVEFFLNGISQGSNLQSGAININAVSVMIGENTIGEFWSGLIDEVRIYERALGSAEIQQHYAAGAEKHQLVVND